MQSTVRTYDRATRSGSVLLDDGTELPFDAAAFDASGLRHVRLGQRVRVRLDESASRVAALTLATFDLHP